MKDKAHIAVIGVSGRGSSLLGLLLEMDDVEVLGVSDLYQDRVDKAVAKVQQARGTTPIGTTDYRQLLDLKDLDAIITPSSWTSHAQICLDAMDAGKYAATEVGGATSIEQCWDLVRTSRRTGKPCMLLENCCYGREEMTVLNMIREGLFGELVHAEGGYRHDLRDEIVCGHENRHYRLDNYLHRNGDVYPTHDLGPIAKYLDINRGNRMLSLVSIASKAVGLNAWAQQHKGPDSEFAHAQFAMGDVITTIIKCARGETITLFHDTSLPRPYSRANLLQGTKGIWQEDRHAVSLEGVTQPNPQSWDHHAWEDISHYWDRYEHPLWQWFRQEGVKGGHGGMDWLVLRAYVEAVLNGTDTPIDVYDTAAWMAITTLSEDSCAMGGAPVAIPDFTNGEWIHRGKSAPGKYSLDNWL